MADLKTKIGAYDRATRTVPVTFTSGAVVHDRRVNAVLKDDGSYDQAATQARVAQVGLGVAHKIAVGAIAAQPATPDEAD